MQAGQIELSAELTAAEEVQHKTSSNGCSCTAASAEKALEQRQQSGSSCSTSMSDTDIQHNKKLKRTSSVKSRAAYFEAMTQSSPEQTSCPSPPRQGTPQRRPLKMDSPEGSQRVTPSRPAQHVPHQEVEMADQGILEASHSLQTTPTSLSPDLLNPGPCHHQCPEIQPRHLSVPMQLYHDTQSSSQSHAWGAAFQSAGHGHASSESSADTSSDDGIELQEQTHVEALEHTIERQKAQLIQQDAQSRASASALTCKTQECESLMGIVRELTENRSKLACARTNLAERLAELQHEYMRLMRVADLSRVVSKENVAKAAKVTRSLKQAEDEAVRQQGLISYFKERNRNLKDENLELRERICLLERLDLLSYTHESVCMREFQMHALKETY